MELSARGVLTSLDRYLQAQSCPGTLQDLQRAVLEKGARTLERDGHWPIVDFPLALHRALGGSPDVGEAVAGTCALFYAFADVTDDAEDHDLHTEPWQHWGWEQAVNTGTSLIFLSLAFARDHLPERLAARVTDVFVRAGLEMTYGQHTDLLGQKDPALRLQDYLLMAERKSGASFGAYAQAVAIANAREPERVRQFDAFGRTLGVMFQMISDLHELWSGAPSPDFANRRWSWPLILGVEQATGEMKVRLAALLASAEAERQADLVALLEAVGVRAYATMRIEVYRRKARALAAELGVDREPYVSDLIEVSAFPEAAIAI